MRRTAGWVTVRLRGAVSGRQLTKLAEEIGIRRVRRCGQETELTLRAADLNRVRHLLRGAGVRMRIVKKSPLTHLRPAARRHAGLIAAALTALLLLGGLMQTVLTVTVDGAKDAQQKEEMVRLLAARGIRPGAYFPGVDRDGAAAEVLRSFSGLTYAALRRRGVPPAAHPRLPGRHGHPGHAVDGVQQAQSGKAPCQHQRGRHRAGAAGILRCFV